MLRFFRKSEWSLNSLTLPWGDRPSIYESIRESPNGTPLPDEPLVRAKSRFGWAGGAMDGVFGHHFGRSDSTQKVFEIVEVIRRLLRSSNDQNIKSLYDLAAHESVLSLIDPLLTELEKSLSAEDVSRLHQIARYFATRAAHREAVKFGLALLGNTGDESDLAILNTIGRNEEFTLFTVVAIARIAPEPERVLWDLAKEVRGWGRIQIVEG